MQLRLPISFVAGPLIALVLGAPPTFAHFLWARVDGSTTRKLEISFGELPEEPTTAVPLSRLALARAMDLEGRPLALLEASTGLTCDLGPDVRVASAVQSWGVIDRVGDGTGAFLLEYYAKGTLSIEDAQSRSKLPLEVFVRRDGDQIVATVKRDETPLPGSAVQVCHETAPSIDLVTDSAGQVRWTAAAGRFGVRARWIENRTGTVEGKSFKEVRHYSTLTFTIPEKKAVEASSSTVPASTNPAAFALLKGAHDSRQVMPAEFTGFRCDLVLREGDAAWKGELVYRRRGETEVHFESLDTESVEWTRRQLLNLIGHRRGGDFMEGDGRYQLDLDPEEANPFGKLIHVHDSTETSYRVSDNKVLEVTRTMEGSRFTISVIDSMEADAGKYLANHFLVSYRDPSTGVLQKVEGYRDSYAHTEGVWLPSARVVATIAGDPTPRVRMIRLLGHLKLPSEDAGSR